MAIYIRDNGQWKLATPYINDNGTWKEPIEIKVTSGAQQFLVYPQADVDVALTSAGTYDIVVPELRYAATATIVGGGGGGGGMNGNGDAWVGGGGGSGGFYEDVEFSVTPNETLTGIVGAGGIGASYRFNSNYQYNPRYNDYQVIGGPGQAGGTTFLKRGTTDLYAPTGGTGGASGSTGSVASGGTPNGVSGQAASSPSTTGYGYTGPRYGGDTGLGYGDGADNPGLGYGRDGQDGAILINFLTRIAQGVTITLPQTTVLSRSNAPAYGYGMFKWNGTNWETRSVITDAGDNQGSGDTGWITHSGSGRLNSNFNVGQTTAWFVIPDSNANFNMPLFRMGGAHFSSNRMSQTSYELPGLLNVTNGVHPGTIYQYYTDNWP